MSRRDRRAMIGRAQWLALVWVASCATGAGGPAARAVVDPAVVAPPSGARVLLRGPHGDPGAAETLARAYVKAKLARDWARMWQLSSDWQRTRIISTGKALAERDDPTAQAQGFESAQQVRAMSGPDYFARRRAWLAQREPAQRHGRVYARGVTLARLEVQSVIRVPFPDGPRLAHRVAVRLSDGTRDSLVVLRERRGWGLLEP